MMNMRTAFITAVGLLSILLLQTNTLAGQTISQQHSPPLTSAVPEDVGMSTIRLERLDEMCRQAITDKQVPGIVALVARRGKIVFHRAYGMSDVESKQPMQPDAIFRIASQSKAITATAVMMLWEEGKFGLDDPISKYIPDFANPQVLTGFSYHDTTFSARPASREITIRHLLTHTSGIGYGVIDGDERFQMLYHKAGVTDLFTTEPKTIKESVLRLATMPLHHDPGEAYTYSEGLDVLGYFIEVVSGMSFSGFLETRLFTPLGMNDTYFYLPDEKASRLVTVHKQNGESWEKYPVTFYDTDYPITGAKTFYSGGAGLSSTAKDYATFLQMYLNNGELNGTRILSRTTIEFMMENQFTNVWQDVEQYYGLAFGVVTDLGHARGSQGSEGTFRWGGYFNTQYWADPDEELIGIIMKQTRGPVNDQTGWKFNILVQQAVDD